jgi:sucrose phosphorylase
VVQNFLRGRDPGRDYFFDRLDEDDLSQVVRPRTSPLLREVETATAREARLVHLQPRPGGPQLPQPEVLKRMVEIVRHYLDNGVRIFRLDAVAFLWKESGHDLPQPARDARDRAPPAHPRGACATDAMLITETNIPNQQNLSYFGNGNEAHCVYNFSLPPLLLNTLVTGDCATSSSG